MRYLLDTNTVSALMRVQEKVAACVAKTPREDVAISQVTDFELAIAVHALACGLTLVTGDRAFERLRVRRENWLV